VQFPGNRTLCSAGQLHELPDIEGFIGMGEEPSKNPTAGFPKQGDAKAVLSVRRRSPQSAYVRTQNEYIVPQTESGKFGALKHQIDLAVELDLQEVLTSGTSTYRSRAISAP
jgi:hypothetical protein